MTDCNLHASQITKQASKIIFGGHITAQVLYIFFVISSMTIYTFLVLYLDVNNQIGLATDEISGHKTVNTFPQIIYRPFYVSDEKNYVNDKNY